MALPGMPGRYLILHGVQAINHRASPALTGTIIGEIPSNVELEVTVVPFRTADGYTWINVTYGDQTGWIAAQDHVEFIDLRGHDMVRYLFGNLHPEGEKSRIWKLCTNWAGDGEMIQIQREGGRLFTVKGHQRTNCNFESRYISKTHIHLDYDTSPGGGTVYHMLTNQRIMPRFMAVGDEYLIEDVFEWLYKDSGSVIPGKESVYFPHYVELVAVHESYTFPSGITVEDVAEIRSYFPDGSPFERAWYSGGLLAWKDESGNSTKHSWISGYVDGPDLQRERLDWLEPNLQPIPNPDDALEEPPEDKPVPTRLDIAAIENDPRFLKLWERPRFIGKPAHEDKPMGVNIATPQGKWHVHIRWIPNPDEPGTNYPPPWILNLGDGDGWTVHFDDIEFYAGLEKLKQDGGLNMNIEGNYLFLFSIDPNVLEDAKNVGFGLRFHLKDDDGNDVVYDHLGEHGAIELFPRYNGVDHEGVYGLLVHVPEPWRVQSVGLIVDGRWASVEGEVDYWYFNCILAPDDFRVDYPIIEIPRLGEEPAPEPGPEPTPDPEPEPEPDGDSWGSLFDQLLGILRKIFDWCFAFFW